MGLLGSLKDISRTIKKLKQHILCQMLLVKHQLAIVNIPLGKMECDAVVVIVAIVFAFCSQYVNEAEVNGEALVRHSQCQRLTARL